ncbi:hypothetical protein [Streptomonospora litoralis]|uniref:hypothetical protein n=1 Tax=Streptomonospora litoralis TaxID=2498135 RepID=UPI0010360FF7|nr:hypothetical protein [Streptomonospora litoralis]
MWLTTESDPASLTAQAVARRLVGDGRCGHLVWNPRTGETVQMLPATAPAGGELTAAAPDRACEGRVCVIIRVIGWSHAPFTDLPLCDLDPILSWLDSWEVPRRWPAGAPPSGLQAPHPRSSSERLWARGGHFGHSQVPGAQASAPGAVCPQRLLAQARPPNPPRALTAPAPLPPIERAADGQRHYAGAVSG